MAFVQRSAVFSNSDIWTVWTCMLQKLSISETNVSTYSIRLKSNNKHQARSRSRWFCRRQTCSVHCQVFYESRRLLTASLITHAEKRARSTREWRVGVASEASKQNREAVDIFGKKSGVITVFPLISPCYQQLHPLSN